MQLAHAIRNVEYLVESGRVHAEITLAGAPGKLAFQGNLQSDRSAVLAGASGFSLRMHCDDDACAGARFALRGPAGSAEFRRRVRLATILPRALAPAWESARALLALQQAIGGSNKKRFATLEVAGGISRFWLELDRKAGFCASGRLVKTDQADEQAILGCMGVAAPAGVRASLEGNTSGGGVILALSEGAARMIVVVLAEEESATELAPDFFAPAPQETLAPPQTPTQTPPLEPSPEEPAPRDALVAVNSEHPATQFLDAHRGEPEIAAAIANWKRPRAVGRGPGEGWIGPRLQAYLRECRATAPAMAKILVSYGVPAEVVFVTLLESNFCVAKGFPVSGNDVSSAVGPWQILFGTGKELKMSVLPMLPEGRANPCDDRADWRKATAGAARYFSQMLRWFHNDPLLAVAGFRSGPTRMANLARSAGERLDQLALLRVSYWTVRKYKMANVDDPYVIHFAAAQFIGREPRAHGFSLPEEAGPLAPPPSCPQN